MFCNNLLLFVVRSLFLKNKRIVFKNSSLGLLVKQTPNDSLGGNISFPRWELFIPRLGTFPPFPHFVTFTPTLKPL